MRCLGIGLAVSLLMATQAMAQGWQLTSATSDQALQLTFSADQRQAYLFVCEPADIRITNFGVTQLLDIQTGQPIGDTPGSVMTPGASVMALFTGKGDPEFLPAEAVPNASSGWDLTLRLAKDDKHLKSFGKTDTISLFTTGYTMAVDMSREDQALARDFLKQCKAQ